MRYQNPQLLYALFAIAIPILIHLFNLRKHKTVHFSSIRFLKEIKQKKERISKIKNILILIIRILAITSLVLAFAKPFIPVNNNNKAKNVLIYIDNSFSMDAKNTNGRLLDVVKEKARLIIKSYPNENNFFLLTNNLHALNQKYNKEEIDKAIDKIETTPIIKSISEIISKGESINKKNDHMYIISDMQESTFDLNNINIIDTSLKIFLIPSNTQAQRNITIDSCWINEPVLINKNDIKLFVKIKNHSNNNIEEEVIFLNIDEKQKSQQFINLLAYEEKIIIFNFNNNKEITEGEITINDSPITFDNKLYFTIKRIDKINICCLNKHKQNKSLNTLFKNDTSLFNYANLTLNNIDYNKLKNQDLLIINEIEKISSGLLDVIKSEIKLGLNILLIPSDSINIESYNVLLNELGLNKITKIINKTLEINQINTHNGIFNNVFNSKLENLNYPTTNTYYKYNNIQSNIPLLSLEDNNPFLTVYNRENGSVYQLNSSLNKENTNFTNHALFVPTLINIGIQSINTGKLYNIIGKDDYFTSSYQIENSILLSLKNNTTEIIPTPKTVHGETYYYVNNQVSDNGIYSLNNKKEVLDKIAFNNNTDESNIKSIKINEIKKWIQQNKLSNINISPTDNQKLLTQIKETVNAKEYWNTLLILSLIFFALEILLIKIIKL